MRTRAIAAVAIMAGLYTGWGQLSPEVYAQGAQAVDIDPCYLGYPIDQTYYADGTPAPAVNCTEEDMPFWDCAIDGNHICGPDVVPTYLPEHCYGVSAGDGNTIYLETQEGQTELCSEW